MNTEDVDEYKEDTGNVYNIEKNKDYIEEDIDEDNEECKCGEEGERKKEDRLILKMINLEMADIDCADNNLNEVHTVLHPDLYFLLNSINILCGQTGLGKTRAVFREIGKLKYIHHPYSQFIYVTDEENDKTFLKYKYLIDIPIVKVKYEEAFEYLQDIIEGKNTYEMVRKSPEDYKEGDVIELLNFLNVSNFSLPCLHTLILFDDATDLFTNKKNPLNSLILRNRHHKFTYFFNVHSFTKNTPMFIKKNMRSLWYFGGFSALDFNFSYQQFRSPEDRVSLYNKYKNLKNRDVLYFGYKEDGTKIEVINL
jgi:hypothetical protein